MMFRIPSSQSPEDCDPCRPGRRPGCPTGGLAYIAAEF